VIGGSPPVSLLLPNRDNAGVLDLTLSRLAEHTTYPDFELVVIDDDSRDGSRELLRRWRDSGRFRSFTLLEREHSGVAASLNAGLEVASGELVASLDGDATVETGGWLERMVGLLRSDPRVGVVTASITLDTGRVHARGANIVCREGLHDGGTEVAEPVGERTVHSRVRRPRVAELAPVDRPVEVDASIGCCMLFERALVDEAGGYDLGYTPVWFEDLDLSLSARRLGRKVFWLPEVEVLHRLSMRAAPPSGAARRALRGVAARVPQRAKDAVVAAARLDKPTEEQLERLRGHYEHWRAKWGFDLLNPDLDAVLERYGGTEVCWRYDDAMRAAGEEIAAGFAAAGGDESSR
jgi:GT2 family glycosyltransferase